MSAPAPATPDDSAAVALLEGLLDAWSPSTQEGPAVRYLVAQLAALGFTARIDAAGNAVGIAGEGPRQIVLLGHIDTVPGQVPRRRDGRRVYGRGAVDAKGPLAAFAMAAARWAAGGISEGWQVVVVGAVEEEAASSRGARRALGDYQPAYCVIGEPSGWERVTLGYKGRLLADYLLERPMAHSAGEEPGACEAAVRFWLEVQRYAEAANRGVEGRFGTLDPSLRRMHSESDGLTERAELTIGLRLPPGMDIPQLEQDLVALAGDASLTLRGQERAFRADKRSPLAAAFLAALRAEGAERPAFVTKTGTSDMNVVGPVWRCPIVAYGPGDSALDHTPEEWLDLDEYLASIRVLERVLARLTAR